MLKNFLSFVQINNIHTIAFGTLLALSLRNLFDSLNDNFLIIFTNDVLEDKSINNINYRKLIKDIIAFLLEIFIIYNLSKFFKLHKKLKHHIRLM